MESWIVWFVLAGVILAMEMLTGTFYLVMIALGLAAGGVASLCGLGPNFQAVIAAVVWVVATLILRNTKFGKRSRTQAEKDPNVNMDIGQSVSVENWTPQGTARVMYRGAMWDVELLSGEPLPGTYIIREVRASRLLVEKI